MKTNVIIFVALLLCNNIKSNKLAPKFLPESLTGCEADVGHTNMEYKDIGNGKSAWFGNLTVPITIDANTEFSMELRWWKNNQWDEEKQNMKGKMCYYLQKFGAKAWQELRLGAKPQISDCPIQPGTYIYNNFETNYNDVHLPIFETGRWSGKIVMKKDKKNFCLVLVAKML